MNWQLMWESFVAFNRNATNRLAYGVSTNWWLILLILATVVSVIIGIIECRQAEVREEQNIL